MVNVLVGLLLPHPLPLHRSQPRFLVMRDLPAFVVSVFLVLAFGVSACFADEAAAEELHVARKNRDRISSLVAHRSPRLRLLLVAGTWLKCLFE